MSDMDELLQRKLQALEDGATLHESLGSSTAEGAEVEALVRLAAAVKEVPHPEPSYAAAQAGRQALLSAVRQRSAPGWFRFRWAFAPAMATVALLLVCMVVSVASAGVWLIGPGSARTAHLVDLQGMVQVASIKENAAWKPAVEGQALHAGQQVRTLDGARATLRYRDGSQTFLYPGTVLAIITLKGGWGGFIYLELDQLLGETAHIVVPFRNKDNGFIVHTPAGSTTVWGTRFNVAVDASGRAFFSVDKGRVVVANAGQQVSLTAGQGTAALPDLPPDPPAFTFTLSDALLASQDGAWNVAGVPFQVTDATARFLKPALGASVLIQGRILADGSWVADLVQSPAGHPVEFYFTGIIDSIENVIDEDGLPYQLWKVNGIPLKVNEATELDGEFSAGDHVKVTYALLVGGEWQVLEVKHLDDEDEDEVEATPTATSTSTSTSTPTNTPVGTGTATPTATAELVDTATPTPTPTLRTDCTGNHQPKAQKLADQYHVTYDEIMGWFCQHFGFGEIDLAYSLSLQSGVPVSDIFALRRSGLGWGEIKRIAHYTPTPTATATQTPTITQTPTESLTPTVTETPTITQTPTQSLTPTASGTPTDTATPTPTGSATLTPTATETALATEPEEAGACLRDNHPKAERLARKYHVTYETIMGWFCQHYGFGEIDLAYSLAFQSKQPVEAVFALRASGLGWGVIKQQLGGLKP